MALINCKLTGYEKELPAGSTTGSLDGLTSATMRRGVKLVIRPRDSWVDTDGNTHSYRIAVSPNPITTGANPVPINGDQLGHLTIGGSYGKPDWNQSPSGGSSIFTNNYTIAYTLAFSDWGCSQGINGVLADGTSVDNSNCTRNISPRLKNSEFNEYDSNNLEMVNGYDDKGKMFGNRRYWAMGTWLTDGIFYQGAGNSGMFEGQGVNDSMFPDSTTDDDGSSYILNTSENQDENFQSNFTSTDMNTGTYATAGEDGATSMILACNTKGVDLETSLGLEDNLIVVYIVLKEIILFEYSDIAIFIILCYYFFCY